MKEIGYRIFACFFRLFSLFPMKRNSVFLVMTHDGGSEGNCAVIGRYMKNQYNSHIYCLRRQDTSLKHFYTFFIKKSYQLARAQYIFLDNTFLPMAYLHFRPETKIVQLWHGTGTIKKFGQHVNTGKLGELEKKCGNCYTHVIVNSPATKQLYAECFGVPVEKVQVTGLPRTDVLFQEKQIELQKKDFYKTYPMLADRKIVLYAPTFRDHAKNPEKLQLDIDLLLDSLPKDYVLGLRLHPFVARSCEYFGKWKDRVFDFSYFSHINTLLFCADYLITDYSSIIFDYCALRKPVFFYAYDLEAFSDCGRGFYKDYKTYVPGPVVSTTKELAEELMKPDYDFSRLDRFFADAFTFSDGKSTKRIVSLIKANDL